VDIEAETGDLQALGKITVGGHNGGEGGDVLLAVHAGSVTVGGAGIDASAKGDLSGGGSIELDATSDLSIHGPLALQGGDGGELDVTVGGSVHSDGDGDIDASATDPGGLGGTVGFDAAQDVVLETKVAAAAPKGDGDNGGGLGGELDIVTHSGSVE